MREQIEFALQSACIKYFFYNYPRLKNNLIVIPSGEKRDRKSYISKRTGQVKWYCPAGKKLKQMGVQRGYADVFIAVPNNNGLHGLFVEFKSLKSKQTAEQKEFQQAVESCNYEYVICISSDEFIKIIQNYLK